MRRPHARTTRGIDNPDSDRRSTMEPIHNHLFHQSRSVRTKQSLKPVVFGLVAVLASATVFFYAIIHGISNWPRFRYCLFIDAGSTGTRIHVIEYTVLPGFKLDFVERGALRVNPGLSSYAGDPAGAANSLQDLLAFGRIKVPKEQWELTEIWLMATAGLRLLDTSMQNRIMEECRRVLRASEFKFKDEWASVISGSDEGLYAWVVANYALGTLGAEPSRTTGIMELGGASAQITFVSGEPLPSEFSRTVKYGNMTYVIYSHSLLHFGLNAACDAVRESLTLGEHKSGIPVRQDGRIEDPCTPKGYSYPPGSSNQDATLLPMGNFSACRSAVLTLLQKGKDHCPYPRCSIGSSFVPSLSGKRFLATENFFYTSKFFDLGARASLSDMIAAGDEFCRREWPMLNLRNMSSSLSDADLMHYCFSSAYIVAFLHDSLGISLHDNRIEYANKIGGVSLDWALGAFILHGVGDIDTPSPRRSWAFGDASPTLLSLAAIAIVVPVLAYGVAKWKKTGWKTIYDLEKGRYIVTRIIRNS